MATKRYKPEATKADEDEQYSVGADEKEIIEGSQV